MKDLGFCLGWVLLEDLDLESVSFDLGRGGLRYGWLVSFAAFRF